MKSLVHQNSEASDIKIQMLYHIIVAIRSRPSTRPLEIKILMLYHIIMATILSLIYTYYRGNSTNINLDTTFVKINESFRLYEVNIKQNNIPIFISVSEILTSFREAFQLLC